MTRHHAEAMGLEELKKVMQWSEMQYQSKMLTVEPKCINELMLAVEHTMMRAFMTSGFTLWTRYCEPPLSSISGTLNISSRNFELTGLQARDIVYDCEGPAPFFHPYFKVHLENRKGWQRKLGHDGPLESKLIKKYRIGY